MSFTVPKLPYDYSALEPSIDATTMQIHHDKHHQVGGNAVLASLPLHACHIRSLGCVTGLVTRSQLECCENTD